MTVFVVWISEERPSSRTVFGVFSTEAKAEAYRQQLIASGLMGFQLMVQEEIMDQPKEED